MSGQEFPLTCEWCSNSPASHVAVYDYRNDSRTPSKRHRHFLCGKCAHSVHVLSGGFLSWWLFALAPDDHWTEGECREAAKRRELVAASASFAGEEHPDEES